MKRPTDDEPSDNDGAERRSVKKTGFTPTQQSQARAFVRDDDDSTTFVVDVHTMTPEEFADKLGLDERRAKKVFLKGCKAADATTAAAVENKILTLIEVDEERDDEDVAGLLDTVWCSDETQTTPPRARTKGGMNGASFEVVDYKDPAELPRQVGRGEGVLVRREGALALYRPAAGVLDKRINNKTRAELGEILDELRELARPQTQGRGTRATARDRDRARAPAVQRTPPRAKQTTQATTTRTGRGTRTGIAARGRPARSGSASRPTR